MSKISQTSPIPVARVIGIIVGVFAVIVGTVFALIRKKKRKAETL